MREGGLGSATFAPALASLAKARERARSIVGSRGGKGPVYRWDHRVKSQEGGRGLYWNEREGWKGSECSDGDQDPSTHR